MKKKFVVAVAAVVMAAVMSVSAFAADDVKVPSITGDATGPASEIFVPQSSAEASATANAAYNTLASTEGSVADKLTALAGGKATAGARGGSGGKDKRPPQQQASSLQMTCPSVPSVMSRWKAKSRSASMGSAMLQSSCIWTATATGWSLPLAL